MTFARERPGPPAGLADNDRWGPGPGPSLEQPAIPPPPFVLGYKRDVKRGQARAAGPCDPAAFTRGIPPRPSGCNRGALVSGGLDPVHPGIEQLPKRKSPISFAANAQDWVDHLADAAVDTQVLSVLQTIVVRVVGLLTRPAALVRLEHVKRLGAPSILGAHLLVSRSD